MSSEPKMWIMSQLCGDIDIYVMCTVHKKYMKPVLAQQTQLTLAIRATR